MAAADPANTAYTYDHAWPPGYLPVAVRWFLGPNPNGTRPFAGGVVTTDGGRDWTVKVDADYSAAGVAPQARLYYGFAAALGGAEYTSAIGSFRAINNANRFAQLRCAERSARPERFQAAVSDGRGAPHNNAVLRLRGRDSFSIIIYIYMGPRVAGTLWCRAPTGASGPSTCTTPSPAPTTSTSTGDHRERGWGGGGVEREWRGGFGGDGGR